MQNELFSEPGFSLGDVELYARNLGLRSIVGVDEAGRGPLAGPVYAAAVVLDLEAEDPGFLALLDDSKKLSASARDQAFEAIIASSLTYSIASVDAARIDEINILQATLRCMESAIRAVESSLPTLPDRVFIDGNQRVNTDLPQETIVKGDGRSYAIAAASILAKVSRDREMLRHHARWPEYAFMSNKGYGSKAHRDAISEHGPCAIHRMTFGGVREHAHRIRD